MLSMQAMEIMEINDSPPAAAEAVPEAKDTIRRGLAASDLPAPSDTENLGFNPFVTTFPIFYPIHVEPFVLLMGFLRDGKMFN